MLPGATEPIKSPVPWITRLTLVSAAIALILLVRLLAGVPHLGFVSDDYLLITEDAKLSWYDSSDHLYRVLRNGLCRIMPQFFGMNPEPYHWLGLGAYLCCLGLVAVFLHREKAGTVGTIAGVTLVAFYPRNHPQLFGFVWIQETGAAIGILTGLIFWGLFRAGGSLVAYVLALAGFAFGVGSKETAIIFPALVLLMDLYHSRRSLAAIRRLRFWVPYAGVALVVMLFVGFVLSQRQGRIITPDPQGIYQAHSISGALLAMAREVMNLVLPYTPPFGLRDMKPIDFAGAAFILASVFLVAWRCGTLARWIVSAVWVLAAVFPPSMFARQNQVDQYLFLPIIGVAFALSATVDVAAAWRPWLGAGVAALILLYAAAGARQLSQEREEWASAGRTVQQYMRQVRALAPPEQTDSLILVNSPHAVGRAPVLGSGLRGALIEAGYRRDLRGEFMTETVVKNELVDGLGVCYPDALAPKSPRILVWKDGILTDRTGACAQRMIAREKTEHPWLWMPIYSETSAP